MTISSTTGIVSGIDYQTIIDKLTTLNEKPITLLQSKQKTLQNQSDALGTVSSVLTTLNTQLSSMLSLSDLASISASTSDKDKLTITADTTAALGSYSVTVDQLASAARAISQGFDATTSTIASADGNFAVTVNGTTKTYEVTSSTTLANLRDTINADSGSSVKASIVNTGSQTQPYKLVLTSKNTGASNNITFSTNDTTMTFTNTAGQDAKITVDGMSISRSTNTFSDVVAGVTFTAKAVTTSAVTASVSRDSSSLSSSVQKFVDNYNAVVKQIATLTAYNSTTKTGAVLMGNSVLRSLRSSLANMVTTSVSGLTGKYNSLASIGVAVGTDGMLSFNSSTFSTALSTDADNVQAIFGRLGNSVSSDVKFVAATDKTATGSYKLNVTTPATRAVATGAQTVALSGLAAAENLSFTIGKSTDSNVVNFSVGLTAGSTLDQVVSTLNAAFTAKGVAYTATSSNGALRIQSNTYGSDQTFSVTSDQAVGAAGQLGIGTTPVSSTGVDVAATLDGVSLKGTGQTLTGVSGTRFAGLQLTISSEAAMSTTLNLTSGVANQMSSLLNTYLDSSTGVIKLKQDGLAKSVTSMNDSIARIQKHVDAETARMKKQFTALETRLANYQTTASYITAITNSTTSSKSSSA